MHTVEMPFLNTLNKIANKIARKTTKRTDATVSKHTKVKKCDKNKAKAEFVTNKIKRNRRTTTKQPSANPARKITVFQDDFSYLCATPVSAETHRNGLDNLAHLLRFPEELAQNLIEEEYEIFRRASPLAFLYFAEDLVIRGDRSLNLFRVTPLTELVKRFAEVRIDIASTFSVSF